jgi:asparagine synthetase B (glutamine-hydrolysing)
MGPLCRGPDLRGRFEAPGAVIAQNRLAIIDLVTGDPPVSNEDGTVGAVLNVMQQGELRVGDRREPVTPADKA